jgi:hypothetical protein
MSALTTKLSTSLLQPPASREIVTAYAAGSAPFTTDWQRFIGSDIVIALTGTATSVTVTVERSPTDPSSPAGALTSPADSAGFTGNLSTGIPPNIYTESGVGWWRVNVTAISGGNCTASMSGGGT